MQWEIQTQCHKQSKGQSQAEMTYMPIAEKRESCDSVK